MTTTTGAINDDALNVSPLDGSSTPPVAIPDTLFLGALNDEALNEAAVNDSSSAPTPVISTSTFEWNVRKLVNKTATFEFSLFDVTPVTSSSTLEWNVRKAVNKAATLEWTVGTTTLVTTAGTLEWNVRKAVNKAATLEWTVGSSTAVSSYSTLEWNVRKAVNQPATFEWSLFNLAASTPGQDAQKLQGDGVVELFEIDLVPSGVVYLKNNNPVTFQGNLYEGIAVQITGVAQNATDALARPQLSFAQNDGEFSALVAQGNLNNATVIRRRVLYADLIANRNVTLEQIWRVARVVSLTKHVVTLELRSGLDWATFQFPARSFMPPEWGAISLQ